MKGGAGEKGEHDKEFSSSLIMLKPYLVFQCKRGIQTVIHVHMRKEKPR